MKLGKKFREKHASVVLTTVYLITLFTASFGFLFVSPSPSVSAQSANDSGALQLILKTCKNMKKVDGNNVNNANEPWYKCEKYQNLLNKSLGCSSKMFEAKTNPSVKTAKLNEWYVNEENFTKCYAKAKASYEAIAGEKCAAMQHGNAQEDGPEWTDCRKLEDSLTAALGCTNSMFEETSTPGVWTPKPSGLSDCGTKLTGVGDSKIPTTGGTSDKTTAEIASAKGYRGNAADDGSGDPNKPSCDSFSGSPLSWIICPVVDAGAAFTDFVFNSLVKPLLTDVPVSADANCTSDSDPKCGTYKAWQGFRLLGNIVLIGSMLAIVYAQIRGPR